MAIGPPNSQRPILGHHAMTISLTGLAPQPTLSILTISAVPGVSIFGRCMARDSTPDNAHPPPDLPTTWGSSHAHDLRPEKPVLRWHFPAQFPQDRSPGDRQYRSHLGRHFPERS